MSALLPLFPLRLVAFPGNAIPLHIFEERYKEMVGEAETAGTEFGIVLAQEGGIVNAGCTVVVEQVVQRYPDGRFDVIVRGRRRFSLLSVDDERAYLRGEVEFFDDDDWEPVTPELRERAMGSWRDVRTASASNDGEPDPQHPFLSFQLARTVGDLDFQSLILRARCEAERLRHFVQFAQEYVPRLRYAEKMKRLAPTNGSGHTPASL
ncbi:MAG TPA: LON peptidase substrate-binding domain-containing protein [Bryobacteraceae bacterium]|nr:LON peptidase substrate-binding domain-containing protein [Bryobacteraceae bacterium]